ncbi:hypothetical protein DQ04_10731020 [Trypanosoma grayi]|uniref:hypothetical protein n=1 Tax=Trypanosoma grayi TaxID=71804 RepID=UPI0004F46FDE|nr:hypothetical protein DQ04_10731020 [Trypanosoma grayi]KEG07153.1 hypothetical protein DQ04_10731020 [Trypanosoma grayi]
MKSAAAHFLTAPSTRDGVGEAAISAIRQTAASAAAGVPCNTAATHSAGDDTAQRALHTSLVRMLWAPRPVFLAPLLRSPRVSGSVVLLDSVPCGAVCFGGRVVRCEGPGRNGSATTPRPYTAMLVSDTTGIIAVVQLHPPVESDSGGAPAAALADENSTSSNNSAAAAVGDDDDIRENDYVFVAGRLAFADVSKDVHRVVQGAMDFVAGSVQRSVDDRFCVRGAVRLINDASELHYWALSALETHVRLLAKAQ